MLFVLGIPRCNEPPEVLSATFEAVRRSAQVPDLSIVVDNGDEPLGPVEGFGVVRPGRNVGCAGAWNVICLRALNELEADHVVIINGDCEVARDTFQRLLASPKPAVFAHGFSCFRLSREVWQKVGPFDELYYPVYWEDTDYRRRMQLAGVESENWPVEEVYRPSYGRAKYVSGITHGWGREDGSYQGWRGEKDRWFRDGLARNRERYLAKWGGLPGEETHLIPFGTGFEP